MWHQGLRHMTMVVLKKIPMFKDKTIFHLQHSDIFPTSRKISIPFPTSDTAPLKAFS